MKKNKDFLKMNYRIEVVKDEIEEGYILSIPELKGCITTAETIEEGMIMIEDAKREWIKAAVEEGIKVPEPIDSNRYSGQFKLRMPKSLHKELMERAKKEGTSMNQYCVYLLSKYANIPTNKHSKTAI